MRFRKHYELRLTVQGRAMEETRPMAVTCLIETRGLETRATVKMMKIKEDTMKIPSAWLRIMFIHFIHQREKRN